MKSLKEFITEGKKHIVQTTIGDFAKWTCLNKMPDGLEGKVTPEDCEILFDNGWCDNFENTDEMAEFINKNWDESIKVTSMETPNDWEISFKFKGKEYVSGNMYEFGALGDREE